LFDKHRFGSVEAESEHSMGPIAPRFISFSLIKRSIINKRVSKMDLKADRQNIIISKFSEYPSSQSITTELADGN